MTIYVKTPNIELEYADEHSIFLDEAKKRIIDLLDKVYEKEALANKTNPKCKYCGGEDKGQ